MHGRPDDHAIVEARGVIERIKIIVGPLKRGVPLVLDAESDDPVEGLERVELWFSAIGETHAMLWFPHGEVRKFTGDAVELVPEQRYNFLDVDYRKAAVNMPRAAGKVEAPFTGAMVAYASETALGERGGESVLAKPSGARHEAACSFTMLDDPPNEIAGDFCRRLLDKWYKWYDSAFNEMLEAAACKKAGWHARVLIRAAAARPLGWARDSGERGDSVPVAINCEKPIVSKQRLGGRVFGGQAVYWDDDFNVVAADECHPACSVAEHDSDHDFLQLPDDAVGFDEGDSVEVEVQGLDGKKRATRGSVVKGAGHSLGVRVPRKWLAEALGGQPKTDGGVIQTNKAARGLEASVDTIDEKEEGTCDECYGTGRFHGFGAPCSKGCKQID